MPTSRSFKQELVGVFGFPVAENPTQAMIEPAFADMGLDWRYLTVEVHPNNLGDAVRGARAMGWRGFNCTIPHKVAVIEHLDRLTPEAELIGAVNCVVWREETLLGDNTDGKGFVQAMRALRPIERLRAVILGAGGAARAIAFELAMAGAKELTIVNRTTGRGEDLARSLRERTKVTARQVEWSGHYAVPAGTDLLVNATSIGLFPNVADVVPVALDSLRPEMVVADVIPNPPRTQFLRDAQERGCTVVDGLSMLVNQGLIGIRLWTGRDARPEVMRHALEQVFHEQ